MATPVKPDGLLLSGTHVRPINRSARVCKGALRGVKLKMGTTIGNNAPPVPVSNIPLIGQIFPRGDKQ